MTTMFIMVDQKSGKCHIYIYQLYYIYQLGTTGNDLISLPLLPSDLQQLSCDEGREAELIERGSTGSMLQEHFMISGTFESET